MPKLIQVVPPGLLQLLGIADSQGPVQLGDQVVPTIDITPRYNARLLQAQTAGPTAGLAAKDSSVQLVVPAGEYWDVVGAMFTASCAGAAVVPALELNIIGVAVAFIPGTDTVRANPFEHTVAYVPPTGLVLSPGMTITGFIRSTPNSNITGLTRALVRVSRG